MELFCKNILNNHTHAEYAIISFNDKTEEVVVTPYIDVEYGYGPDPYSFDEDAQVFCKANQETFDKLFKIYPNRNE